MFKPIFTIILALHLEFTCWGQFFGASEQTFMNVALRCATAQNQQQVNAAGFTNKDTSGRQFIAALPFRISNFGLVGFGLYYQYKRAAFYHELSGILHPALFQLRNVHALGFALSPQLKVGAGFQIQLLSQPSYYGSFFNVAARLGCQYNLGSQHYIAITLDDIGSPNAQKIGMEHLQMLRNDLFFAQGLCWNPMYRPSTYLTLIQVLPKAKVQLTYGLFPQQVTILLCSIDKKKLTWFFGQSWQRGIGPSLQFGLYL